MIETGLKDSPSQDKHWTHPPKKKWIHCYLTVGEEKKEHPPPPPPQKIVPDVEVRNAGPLISPHQKLSQPSHQRISSARFHSHLDQPLQSHKLSVPQVSPQKIFGPARLETRQTPSSTSPNFIERTASNSPNPFQARHLRRPQPYSPPLSSRSAVTPSNGLSRSDVLPSVIPPRPPISYSSVTTTPTVQQTSSSGPATASKVEVAPLGLVSAFRGYDASGFIARTGTPVTTDPPPPPASPISCLTSGESIPNHINGLTRPNGTTKTISLPITLTTDYEDPAFKDDPNKKRSGTTPSREVHNKLEKNRRAHLKECFETLRRQLPSMDDKKISNQTILKAAHRHILTLKRKEREYEHEMERLARLKIANQQHLATLKKELSARWDHIDFSTLLPDMASIEHQRDKETKSTTTASEQPDIEDGMERLTLPLPNDPSSLTPPSPTHTLSSHNHRLHEMGNATGIPYPDLNQPLNLSTSPVEMRSSPRRLPSPTLYPHQGPSPPAMPLTPVYTTRLDEDSWTGNGLVRASVVASSNAVWPVSNSVTRHLPSHNTMTRPNLPMANAAVVRPIFTSSNQVRSPTTTLAATVRAVTCPSHPSMTTETNASHHTLPIMGAGGLLPAQLVANSMQLNGAPGSIIGQPAIQVIPPEGYKLLPADHATNGTKPLTITLAHTGLAEGLERGFGGEDGKPGPVMVTVNKNGLSALHLAVPSTARSIPHTQVSGSSQSVKMSQTGNTSLLPSYLPVAHNGMTQLVPSMSLVGPLMVSQPQRGPGTVGSVGKTIKTLGGPGGTTHHGGGAMPLVPAQYANTLPGGQLTGLVNSVVVVSTPGGVGLMSAPSVMVSSASAGNHAKQ